MRPQWAEVITIQFTKAATNFALIRAILTPQC